MAGRRLKSSLFLVLCVLLAIGSYFEFVYTNSVSFSLVYASLSSDRPENDTTFVRNNSTTVAAEVTFRTENRWSNVTVRWDSSGSALAGTEGLSGSARTNGSDRSTIKTILLWTPKYGSSDFGLGLGRSGFQKKRCPESRCSLTDDRSTADRADAILFHAWDTSASAMPSRTNREQIWIFYSLESPLTVADRIRGTNDRYNLTVTYLVHPDTDVVTHIRRLKPPASDRKPEASVRTKTKMAVWPVSNCRGAASARNLYAERLAHHTQLDVYGRCGDHHCPIDDKATCYAKFESKYYFYLSFENSVCQQYVTEKVYAALRRNIVPVILGGGDYAELLPPKSYLDVRHFDSPRHLANYMKYLRTNTSAYLEYLAWKADAKRHIERINNRMSPSYGKMGTFCRLCEILHDPSYPYKSGFDVEDYWNPDKLCLSGLKERKALHLV